MNYKINNVTGYFDCRQFKANTSRSSRVIIENGGRINFTVSLTDEELEEHPELKDFAKKSEKSGLNYVSFKIFPKNCKLYTASAQQVEFPDNRVLDGVRFEANIYFNVKHGVGTELNGCYVNAIQIIRRADNPFYIVEDGDDKWLEEVIVGDPFEIEEVKKTKPEKLGKKIVKTIEKGDSEGVDDLPF